jgi:hypothetical protein
MMGPSFRVSKPIQFVEQVLKATPPSTLLFLPLNRATDHDNRRDVEAGHGSGDHIPPFGRFRDPAKPHDLPLRECPELVSEALDCSVVGDDRRERIRSRPLIVADQNGLVDPCAQGQI